MRGFIYRGGGRREKWEERGENNKLLDKISGPTDVRFTVAVAGCCCLELRLC